MLASRRRHVGQLVEPIKNTAQFVEAANLNGKEHVHCVFTLVRQGLHVTDINALTIEQGGDIPQQALTVVSFDNYLDRVGVLRCIAPLYFDDALSFISLQL